MDFIEELIEKSGSYKGTGMNHEGDEFIGKLQITPVLSNTAFEIKFNAASKDGLEFHDEVSILSKDDQGNWALFNTNSNSQCCTIHQLESSDKVKDKRTLSFMYGQFDNTDSFRERVCLDLFQEDQVAYHYYWGVPGGAFQYRSGLVMKAVTTT
jgi:hypothetical protein